MPDDHPADRGDPGTAITRLCGLRFETASDGTWICYGDATAHRLRASLTGLRAEERGLRAELAEVRDQIGLHRRLADLLDHHPGSRLADLPEAEVWTALWDDDDTSVTDLDGRR